MKLEHIYSDMISKHITFREATHSATAKKFNIDNTPDMHSYINMKLTAIRIFEPLRSAMGDIPIAITSFYRCKELNLRVGGAPNSQHMEGKAMDLDADIHGKITNEEIFTWLRKYALFDQLIAYGKHPYRFVHVSYNLDHNRKKVLFLP